MLTFGDEVVAEPDLEIPHPRIGERAFVLVPLAEIAPQLQVGSLGNAAELAGGLGADGSVRPVED